MKKLALVALLGLGLWLSSCASNTVSPTPTTGAGGNWEAQLYGGTGEAALLDFVSNFSVGSDSETLTINSFSFINVSPNSCFPNGSSESGSVLLQTTASNQVTGSLMYTITSSTPSNTLTLTTGTAGQVTGTSNNGALVNGVVQGTWSLTGSCTGSGSFVMCQEAIPNGQDGCGTASAAKARESSDLR
jgi:hypothetical protein